MGFYLHGLLVLSEHAVALYDRVIPGAGQLALPTHGDGLPDGFFLPLPWVLEGVMMEAKGWFAELPEARWRAQLGLPVEEDPELAYELSDYRLASLVSLASASGVLLLTNETEGGILDCEYVAAFHGGVCRAAAGTNYLEDRSYYSEGGRYHAAQGALRPGPTERGAALLDSRFENASLYDGYLPQKSDEGAFAPRSGRLDWGEVPALQAPIDPAWEPWFPVFTALTRAAGSTPAAPSGR